jgi:hypothetical protein
MWVILRGYGGLRRRPLRCWAKPVSYSAQAVTHPARPPGRAGRRGERASSPPRLQLRIGAGAARRRR